MRFTETVSDGERKIYVYEVDCLTPGFYIGGQTTGYTSEGSQAEGDVVDGRLILRGKKMLAKLAAHKIFLFKSGCGIGKKDRFFPDINPLNFDPSPLTRAGGVEKYSVFRAPDDGNVYVTRNIEPRFTAVYRPGGETSDISFVDFRDEMKPDPVRLAKMMRGIGEAIARFLQQEEYERRKENR